MSEQQWPADIPHCPTADSLSNYQPESTVTGFVPDVGPAITHERATSAGARVTFSYIWTHAQLVSWHEWYVYSLRRGSRVFRMDDPVMREPARWKIELGSVPNYERISTRWWRCTLALYRMP